MKSNRHLYSDRYPSCFLKKALFLTALFFLTDPVLATTYYADVDRSNDSGDGLSWATAKHTIQAAVDLAAGGDTVLVADGTYIDGRRKPSTGYFDMILCVEKPITVRAANGPGHVSISGWMGIGCVYLRHGAVFSEIKIKDASNGGMGLHIYENGIAENCVITGNEVGGVWLDGGGTLTNCWISGNSGGSGVCLGEGGLLTDCVVSNNHFSGGAGGGVNMALGGRMEKCVVVHNSASDGGGVYMEGGAWFGGNSGVVQDCELHSNSADLHV